MVKKAAARGAELSETESHPIMNDIEAFNPLPRANIVIKPKKRKVNPSAPTLEKYACESC